MHQSCHKGESESRLDREIDRIQMSPSDRARAKAQMLRAQFIADLILKAANGLKETARAVVRAVQNRLAKSKTRAGYTNYLLRRNT